ncbi:MAG: hypothetical protein BWY70_01002 [Bacteroidetes bacterium ADurb.Bin408]|nr:MAG: hypothetical protein BWY70_01002 [Bacteroidetes bacterium ADurb.Bin408]
MRCQLYQSRNQFYTIIIPCQLFVIFVRIFNNPDIGLIHIGVFKQCSEGFIGLINLFGGKLHEGGIYFFEQIGAILCTVGIRITVHGLSAQFGRLFDFPLIILSQQGIESRAYVVMHRGNFVRHIGRGLRTYVLFLELFEGIEVKAVFKFKNGVVFYKLQPFKLYINEGGGVSIVKMKSGEPLQELKGIKLQGNTVLCSKRQARKRFSITKIGRIIYFKFIGWPR